MLCMSCCICVLITAKGTVFLKSTYYIIMRKNRFRTQGTFMFAVVLHLCHNAVVPGSFLEALK